MAHVYARPHHMLQTEEEVLDIVEDDPSTSTREIARQIEPKQTYYLLVLSGNYVTVGYLTLIMRKSPVTVQEWVNTLPPVNDTTQTPTTNVYSPQLKSLRQCMSRDLSLQSEDGSSVCSSVGSVLELRKPDPEEVLLELGFGPSANSNSASRIPNRFLHPSEIIPEVDFNKFLEEYGQRLPEPQ
ncbi:hypothetical protein NQ317_001097 [Molorchus minor]|uniref:ITPR-interacting domain-containing protein n=1 Tax=Molorchus minor TaxID=1323400 RepID=A0ABQ9IYE1_9CUCU|nr:hypothetical protein NQ317_001097 [Molorchus minor]